MVYTDAATLRRTFLALVIALMLALMTVALSRPASALTVNVIPITGQLLVGGAPVTGNYDLQFQLYNAVSGGSTVGPLVTITNVAVADGVFYAEVNFGALSLGNSLWVQTNYRAAGAGNYAILSPRHVVPSVVYAADANYATLAGTTFRINNVLVGGPAPTTGQVLTYSGTRWAAAALPAPTAYTAGAGLTLTGSQFSVAVPLALTGTSNGPILTVSNVNGNGYGIFASSTAPGYSGIRGDNFASDPTSNGVAGVAAAGAGVAGYSTSGYGVQGTNTTTSDYGFLGGTEPSQNSSVGVYGNDATSASSGSGVFGFSTNGHGVAGLSINGAGGYFSSAGTDGVYGESTAANGGGVVGYADNGQTAFGVYGESTSGTGTYGQSSSGLGVEGISNTSTAVQAISTSGYGIYAQSGSNYAGYFTTGGATGLIGVSTSTNGTGIRGVANTGPVAVGVYGSSATGFAALLQGKVEIDGNLSITGSITAGTKDFKIDDPLDPTGKYLTHACIESNEMSDIYSGNIATDAQGNATVTMPNWFGALNKDFRYQLTVIGQFAQAVVSSEIQNNRFGIKTDKPNVKVSWQVTGVRQDAYASAHPLQVEEDKPVSEQGLFLHPTELGQSETAGIGYQQQQAHKATKP